MSDDTISRQAAIDAMETHWDIIKKYHPTLDSTTAMYVDHKIIIEDLPSVQPEQWIPCSERLPEDLEEVNVTWINTDPEPYYDFIKGKPFTGTAVYYKGRWFWYSAICTDYLREYGFSPNDLMDDSIKIVAWQPIPEPYKGEQE